MNEFITTANGLIALITALVTLITTGVSTFIAVKQLIKNHKGKIWELIKKIAEDAMAAAEKSELAGSSKKEMAINIVTTTCEAQGIDIKPFLSQLDLFIDQTIALTKQINVK